ncbi:hypothetical protein JST97_08100 [bacterium]|nr:hypothetical protein [bacterium]
MSGATELELYLEGLQTEGNLQSRGQFTLDFHKALEKLSGMARQNVHRWVFFAVQAAVGFGAAEMRISASSQAMSLCFWVDHECPTLLDGYSFQGVEEKPDLRGDEAAAQNLRQALLWGRALNPSSFAMMVEGDHPGYVLSATDNGMEYKNLPPKPGTRTACALILNPGKAYLGISWAAALQSEAVYRLSFCPVPLHMDGLELSLGESSSLMRNKRRREGNVKLWERYLFSPETEGASLAVAHPSLQPAGGYWLEGRPPFVRERNWLPASKVYWLDFAGAGSEKAVMGTSLSRGLCLAQWTEPGRPEPRQLWLEIDPQVELPQFKGKRVRCRALFTRMRVSGNYLILSRHGMLLDPLPMEGLPCQGWVAVVASNMIHTDASGLVVVQDDRLRAIQEWVRAEIYALHQRMADYRTQ